MRKLWGCRWQAGRAAEGFSDFIYTRAERAAEIAMIGSPILSLIIIPANASTRIMREIFLRCLGITALRWRFF
jgi:hypothetical protein